jgi:hypothetical protein
MVANTMGENDRAGVTADRDRHRLIPVVSE